MSGFFGGIKYDRAFTPVLTNSTGVFTAELSAPRNLAKELDELKERVAYLETNMQALTDRSIQ